MMRSWQLSELAQPLQGSLSGGDATISDVSIDSRSVCVDELFVALCGEKFDGHDYLQRAEQAGAVAALVSDDREITIPSLRVADTKKALGLLGAHNRNAFEGTVVAITGSGGKTTAKNMVSAVLSQRGSTLATAGNFNNEIGVPLTLLKLAPEHEFAVIEMGAARVGDIRWLVNLGRPSIAVLLNAMPAHLESFGSIEDVARGKGEIFDGLGPTDVAIINADQPWAEQWRQRAGDAQVLDFSLGGPAAVSAQTIEIHGLSGSQFIAKTPLGEFPVSLKLAGKHNVANALAAIAVGVACGLSVSEIQQGLSLAAPVVGRIVSVPCANGAVLIDDCYNAQPGSVKAAIDLLAESRGRRTLVLGAMKELGPDSEALHVEVALYAKGAGIEQFWGVGGELREAVQAFGEGGMFFLDRQQVSDSLAGVFSTQDTILVKGSRGAGMEVVLAAIATDEPSTGA